MAATDIYEHPFYSVREHGFIDIGLPTPVTETGSYVLRMGCLVFFYQEDYPSTYTIPRGYRPDTIYRFPLNAYPQETCDYIEFYPSGTVKTYFVNKSEDDNGADSFAAFWFYTDDPLL